MPFLQSSVYIAFRASSFSGDRSDSKDKLNEMVISELFGADAGLHYRLADAGSDAKSAQIGASALLASDPSYIEAHVEDDRRLLSDILGSRSLASDLTVSFPDKSEIMLTVAKCDRLSLWPISFANDGDGDMIVLASRDFISPIGARLLHLSAFTNFLAKNGAFIFVDYDASDSPECSSSVSAIGCDILFYGQKPSDEERKEAYANNIDDAFYMEALQSMEKTIRKNYEADIGRIHGTYSALGSPWGPCLLGSIK